MLPGCRRHPAAADVAHGALPYIGGARLAPGQLSFATLATAASHRLGGTQHCSSSSSDDDDDLQVDGFGKGARRTARARTHAHACYFARKSASSALPCQGLAYSSERDFASEFLR